MSLVINDTFTDVSATALASHTPDTGGVWTKHVNFGTGAAVISNANRCRNSAAANTVYYNATAPASADYDVEADFNVQSLANGAGVMARVSSSATTYYNMSYSIGASQWQLFCVSAGVTNSQTNFGQVLTVGQTYHVRISVRGGLISGYVDGKLVVQVYDANNAATGFAGMFFASVLDTDTTGIHLDNFQVSPALLNSVTNTNLFFSPGNWFSDGSGTIQPNNVLPASTFARTTNPGAYVKGQITSVANGYATMNLDITPIAGVTAANAPRVAVSIDGSAFTTTLLATNAGGTQQINLGSALSAGTHTFVAHFQGVVLSSSLAMGDRWTTLTTGASVVKVTGVECDSKGSALAAPTLRSKRAIIFGDSISEGANAVLGSANGAGDQDATASFLTTLTEFLDAEYGIVGWSSQGYEQVGYGNVPVLSSSYDHYDGTNLRNWIAYDYVIDDHGTNGATSAADVQTMLANYRAKVAGAAILKLQTFNQVSAANISTGVANYKTANPTDTKVYLVDPGAVLLNGLSSNDNLHPNFRGHPRYAELLIKNYVAQTTAAIGTTLGSGRFKS